MPQDLKKKKNQQLHFWLQLQQWLNTNCADRFVILTKIFVKSVSYTMQLRYTGQIDRVRVRSG